MKTNIIGPALFAAVAFCTTASHAQTPASGAHPVTVITLYSETRSAPGTFPRKDENASPPIQIVNGGVKEPDGTCFDMDDSGHITPAGSCVTMRSAGPGERPPAN